MATALYFLLLVTYPWQEEAVPYKPANEYEVLIDYKIQDRPPADRTKVYEAATDEKNRNTTSGPLPYLKLQLKLLKLSDEEIKNRLKNWKRLEKDVPDGYMKRYIKHVGSAMKGAILD